MDTDFLTQTSGLVGSQPELHDPFLIRVNACSSVVQFSFSGSEV